MDVEGLCTFVNFSLELLIGHKIKCLFDLMGKGVLGNDFPH